MNNGIDFGKDGIWKILFKLAPPVMAAQLIQALYNMVDSIFVGRYSEAGLTALSIIYPIQLLMIAVAVGTGVGINTLMAHYLGMGKVKEKDENRIKEIDKEIRNTIYYKNKDIKKSSIIDNSYTKPNYVNKLYRVRKKD